MSPSVVSNYFQKLSMDQVTAIHRLILLLRKLKTIGTLELETVTTISPIDFDNYDVDKTKKIYGVIKIGYDPVKGRTDIEDLLDKLFGRTMASYLRIT